MTESRNERTIFFLVFGVIFDKSQNRLILISRVPKNDLKEGRKKRLRRTLFEERAAAKHHITRLGRLSFLVSVLGMHTFLKLRWVTMSHGYLPASSHH